MNDSFRIHHKLCNTLIRKFTDGEFINLDIGKYIRALSSDKKVNIIGAGKASLKMAQLAEQELGDRIHDGLIIVPDASMKLKRIQLFEGSHPYPDANSVSASYEMMEFARKIPKDESVLLLLSGGASSLFCIPAGQIELDELNQVYRLLLESGAGIDEINLVRKHLTQTGGGQLGEVLSEHELLSIIVSDVPGDDPTVIGSAPTVADPTTFKEAFQVLKHYSLWNETPHVVRVHLTKGMQGEIPETIKPDSIKWDQHTVQVISGAEKLGNNVGAFLSEQGYNTSVKSKAYDEDVRVISKEICSDAIHVLSKKAKLKPPAAMVYFGESRVQVTGTGKGGRNQELALNAALSIEGQHPISVLSLATDGADGPTDAAGALVNSNTCLMARKQKLKPEEFLKENDSYHFHQKMETLVKTGRTGENLMDLQVVLVGVPNKE